MFSFSQHGHIFFHKQSKRLQCFLHPPGEMSIKNLSRKIISETEFFYLLIESPSRLNKKPEKLELRRHLINLVSWEESYEIFDPALTSFVKAPNSKLVLNYAFWTTTIFLRPVENPKANRALAPVWDCERNDHVLWNSKRWRVMRIHDESHGRDLLSNPEAYKVLPFCNKNWWKTQEKETKLFENVLCYDCETNLFGNDRHEPYLLAWHFYQQTTSGQILGDESGVFEWEDLRYSSPIPGFFVDQLQDLMLRWEIRSMFVYGYNNFNFDDHFLFRAFESKKWNITKSERNGKTTHWECTKTVVTHDLVKTTLIVHFSDLIKWLPDVTLAQATKEFQSDVQKMDFDVVKYNSWCREEKKVIRFCSFEKMVELVSAVTFNQKRILKQGKYKVNDNLFNVYALCKDYCIIDVESTHALYISLQKGFNAICHYFVETFHVAIPWPSILQYISPSYMISIIYKQVFDNKGMKRISCRDPELASFYAAAYYGGYVNYGFLGEYITSQVDAIKCFDVTAMYPTAMTNTFPVIHNETDFLMGDSFDIGTAQNIIDKTILARNKAFEDKSLFNMDWVGELGETRFICKCDLEPPPFDKRIPISSLPCRFPHCDKLFYGFIAQKGYTTCSSEMKTLILTGWKIKIVPYKYNTFFLQTDSFFETILRPLNTFKIEAKQDSNQAKKKLAKLLMNSISGKLGQRLEHSLRVSQTKRGLCKGSEIAYYTSLHYLACFITAESRWIIFSKIYELHRDVLFQGRYFTDHAGLFLYCDTDSITFDSTLVAECDFPIGDDMGSCVNGKYIVYWKEKKYPGIKSLFIMGRKSYVPCTNAKIPISWTLKGIHRRQMKNFTYDVLKEIASHVPKTIFFQALQRKPLLEDNDEVNIFAKAIIEVELKKTLSISADSTFYNPTNEKIIEANKDNLEMVTYKEGFVHYLAFNTNSTSAPACIRSGHATASSSAASSLV